MAITGTSLLAGALNEEGYLWAGTGNPATGFKTVQGGNLQIGFSVRETQNMTPLEGSFRGGAYNFSFAEETAAGRFAYSVATVNGEALDLSAYTFKLNIDTNAGPGSTYKTFILQKLPENAETVAQPSGYGWFLDKNGDGKIDFADTIDETEGGEYTIIKEWGTQDGSVTQNIQNIGWYDADQSTSVVAKGTYDVSIEAINNATGQIELMNKVVLNYAGGIASEAPAEFEAATPIATVVGFFEGSQPLSAGRQASLENFVNDQHAAYSALGVADATIGAYEALGLGFSKTDQFVEKYGETIDNDFIVGAYREVFGRDATVAQALHFKDQINYFESLYTNAGVQASDANVWSKGAVIGQMLGFSTQEGYATDPTSSSFSADFLI